MMMDYGDKTAMKIDVKRVRHLKVGDHACLSRDRDQSYERIAAIVPDMQKGGFDMYVEGSQYPYYVSPEPSSRYSLCADDLVSILAHHIALPDEMKQEIEAGYNELAQFLIRMPANSPGIEALYQFQRVIEQDCSHLGYTFEMESGKFVLRPVVQETPAQPVQADQPDLCIVSLTSTCSSCGYVETMTLTDPAEIEKVPFTCPQCDLRRWVRMRNTPDSASYMSLDS